MLLLVTPILAQEKKPMRYSAGGDVAAIGGGGFAYGGTIEYKFLTEKNLLTDNHLVGGNLLVGVTVAQGIHLLVGGGYDLNITKGRGQFYTMAKFNSPVIVVSGKLLFSGRDGNKYNYETAVTIFPGQNVVGIGGFYLTDYDCTVIGAKLTFRFGRTNGSSSKRRNDCDICNLGK